MNQPLFKILSNLDDKKRRYKELIDSYFEQTGPKDYSFKASLKRNIAHIVKQLLEILVYYFDKYSEEEFHTRMNEHYVFLDKKTGIKHQLWGFAYIDDFKRYHKYKFIFFIKAVQAQKFWFEFDEKRIYDITVALLEVKGWILLPHEYDCIRHNIRRLYNILYHSKDSLEDISS